MSRWWPPSRWPAMLRHLAILAVVTAVVILLIAWSGVYNVAASRGHTQLVEWFLRFGMENSVKTRSFARDEPQTFNADMIALGAAHYRDGCAYCHGAPGTTQPLVAQQMLPPPPLLIASSSRWKDHELHWIVQHGLKYTGMPAWPSQKRADEVWALVAFLKALPSMSAMDYERLASGNLPPPSAPQAVALCGRCHGVETSGPSSALIPIIHAQPREMIVRALGDYRSGTRESGVMQPIVMDLSERQIDDLASYYASLPHPGAGTAPSSSNHDGRALAHEGAPADGIPPCLLCHGAEATPSYPRLAGQSAAYIVNQLRLWKAEDFRRSGHAAIMTPIARRLSERQIEDVAAYLSRLPSGDSR